MNIQEIKTIIQGKKIQCPSPDHTIEHLLTDSRKVIRSSGTLFFAISGVRHNGHDYIPDLYQQGVRNFVVEQSFDPNECSNLPLANIIQVDDSTQALQELAGAHRRIYGYPIIAITGSYGKTVVKEWLSQMLADSLKVIKTPKSYNSQIGVALSLWEMNDEHQLGVIEAGISQVGEMSRLAKMICPSIGILTNLGVEHDQGFASQRQKLVEKLKLFSACPAHPCQRLILDHQTFELYPEAFDDIPLFRWGADPSCDLQLLSSHTQANETTLATKYLGKVENIVVPFTDPHAIQNIIHCIACLLVMGYDLAFVASKLLEIKQVSTRLELKQGIKHNYIIDDTYNNDLGGLKIALDFLQNQHQGQSKTLILSDLNDQGQDQSTLYPKVAQLIQEKGVQKMVGIGPQLCALQYYFRDLDSYFYESTTSFLKDIEEPDFHDEMILVKGAKSFEFSKIIDRLQYKSHRTVFEINLDALVHNLNYYRSLLGQSTKLMVMVKAFAYGSGAAEIANLLQFNRVDYLAVAYADEGVQLREQGITLPIMVMNPDPDAFHSIITYHLEPEIYSFRMLSLWESFLQSHHNTLNIHIKIDTGMHRLGFLPHEIEVLGRLLAQNPQLKVQSVMSHLAGADELQHQDFTLEQFVMFQECCLKLEEILEYEVIKHILNSPGIVRYPEHCFDMVRLGIGLYGAEPNRKEQAQLKTIGRLKTNISQIKSVKAGQTVGYGRHGKINHDTRIATIAIGYADGLNRAFGNGVGKVKIANTLCPIIGNVCMDMTMVEIGDLPVQEGDEVIIFDEDHNIWTLAESIHTIPYEILTSISQRVKRVYFVD